MEFDAGLDVSLEEIAICIVDADGSIVVEMQALSDPEAIGKTLAETNFQFKRI